MRPVHSRRQSDTVKHPSMAFSEPVAIPDVSSRTWTSTPPYVRSGTTRAPSRMLLSSRYRLKARSRSVLSSNSTALRYLHTILVSGPYAASMRRSRVDLLPAKSFMENDLVCGHQALWLGRVPRVTDRHDRDRIDVGGYPENRPDLVCDVRGAILVGGHVDAGQPVICRRQEKVPRSEHAAFDTPIERSRPV